MSDDDLWITERTEPRRPPRPGGARASATPPASPAPDGGAASPVEEAGAPAGDAATARRPGVRRWSGGAALLIVGALLGGAGAGFAANRGDDPRPGPSSGQDRSAAVVTTIADATTTSPDIPATTVATTTTDVAAATTSPPVPAGTSAEELAKAQALAPLTLPSDCGLPFDVAESMPNGARDYRGGVHEGIDFICSERGRDAVAALDGQVVVANESYVDPTNEEREEILATARSLGYTPPWTLAMLFGRVVVIDHGVRPAVGHVVTIYAHLEEIDDAIRPGAHVTAGQRLGEIGNRGTETAATGGTRPQSIHLHWEIHLDDHFLGEGQSFQQTAALYRALFGR